MVEIEEALRKGVVTHQVSAEGAGPVGADSEDRAVLFISVALKIGEAEGNAFASGWLIANRLGIFDAQVTVGLAHPEEGHAGPGTWWTCRAEGATAAGAAAAPAAHPGSAGRAAGGDAKAAFAMAWARRV